MTMQVVEDVAGSYTVTLSGSSSYKGFLIKTDVGTLGSFSANTKAKTGCGDSAWTHSTRLTGGSQTATLTVTASGKATFTWLVVRPPTAGAIRESVMDAL